MGRHKTSVSLSLKPRPQVLLHTVELDERGIKRKELEKFINEFRELLGSKMPLMRKDEALQNWLKEKHETAELEDWKVYLKFLVDDHVLFAEDRERIVSFETAGGETVAAWKSRNGIFRLESEEKQKRQQEGQPEYKTKRLSSFRPALNEGIWKRYQEMKRQIRELNPDIEYITSNGTYSLRRLFQRVRNFLEKEHPISEIETGPEPRADYLARLKKSLDLEQIFSKENVDEEVEFCAGLQSELKRYDPDGTVHALIWFFYLAQKQVLQRAFQSGYMKQVIYDELKFNNRKYYWYRDRFLTVQQKFPPQRDSKQIKEIQQELFLLMTGFLQEGCKDSEFQELRIVRFYQELCKIADQHAAIEPETLWSFPWGIEEKAEYKESKDVKVYHKICDFIRSNTDLIERQMRGLEKDIRSSLNGDDRNFKMERMALLHSLSTLSDKKEFRYGMIRYKDFTNVPGFFTVPIKLPDSLSAKEKEFLPRCIREYTALSLLRTSMAELLKETALNMLTEPYRKN